MVIACCGDFGDKRPIWALGGSLEHPSRESGNRDCIEFQQIGKDRIGTEVRDEVAVGADGSAVGLSHRREDVDFGVTLVVDVDEGVSAELEHRVRLGQPETSALNRDRNKSGPYRYWLELCLRGAGR